MSSRFIKRLKQVHEEFDAAREAVLYVDRNWDRLDIYNELGDNYARQHFKNASESLEAVFVIRLFTTFEGILKEHLAKNHPRITVEEDARVVVLVDRVASLQRPRISAQLRVAVHDVRRFRNFLVHAGVGQVRRIAFVNALAALSKYADKLPDPPR